MQDNPFARLRRESVAVYASTYAGPLTVPSWTVTGALAVGGNTTLTGTLAVTGASAFTGAVTMASTLAVTGATTLSAALSGTTGTFSSTLGVTGTLSANTIAVLTGTTATVYNTSATTVDAFGAGTAITIGATTGTATIRNATVALTGTTGFTVAAAPTFKKTPIYFDTTVAGTGAAIFVMAPAGTNRHFARLFSGNNETTGRRWDFYANSDAESGANAGSNLRLAAYDDSGTFIDDVLIVPRVGNGEIVLGYGGRNVRVGDDTLARNTAVTIDTAATYTRLFQCHTASVARWAFGANGTAESGANAGSNFVINAFADAGTAIDTPVTIARVSGGDITITRPLVGAATQSVFNTVSTTVNAFGAATTLNIGNASGATALAGTLDVGGNVAFGNSASVSASNVVSAYNNFTATSGTLVGFDTIATSAAGGTTSATYRGIRAVAFVNSTQSHSGSFQGGVFQVDYNAAATGAFTARGAIASLARTAAGTISDWRALSTSMSGSNTTVTTGYGLYLDTMTIGTNAYGIYIANVSGASTLNYAIYTGAGAVRFGDSVTIADAKNIVFDTTTGTKIGTATGQKLAFHNSTPTVQYATTGTSTGFTAGAGTTVTHLSTFTGNSGSTGYTIADIVLCLKTKGLMAA